MSHFSFKNEIIKDEVDTEAEVELISLITEQLPHYKLRADYSVRFSGYHHSDFNRAEQVKEEITELTNDQIHQTLEYFILCGLRVNKMTDTYEDCAALTLLVQEQRSHLDLAANIGLNLVEKNTQLEQRIMSLEDQLEASNETMKQMRHQLTLKDDLLRMFHSEIDDSEDQNNSQAESTESVFFLDKVNVKQLETKLSKLEEENLKLRDKQQSICNHTDLLETKETQLVNDCVTHILESTKTIDRLSIELNKKTNDYLNQHEEISRLLTSKIDLENKTHKLLTENDNLITQLRDHQTKEFTLTKELADMRDRYDECINLLNEKQDEIRRLKKMVQKELMKDAHYYYKPTSDFDITQNLATELEESCRLGAEEMDRSRTLRIMEQARSLNTAWTEGDDETSSGFTDDMGTSMTNVDAQIPVSEQLSGNVLLRRSIQDDCERRRLLRSHHKSPILYRDVTNSASGTITPKSPMDTMQSSYLSEAMFHRERCSNGFNSLNNNIINHNGSLSNINIMHRLPDKLQLIKPLEGSHTLKAWQNLATPSLTKTLFGDQPSGVCFRGQQVIKTSSESSPNSDETDCRPEHRARLFSEYDDVDYEEPAPTIRAKDPESHSITHTYSNSKISNSTANNLSSDIKRIINLDNLVLKGESFSSFNLSTHNTDILQQRRASDDFCDNITDVQSPSSECGGRPSQLVSNIYRQPPSWLDRFTVGSIMTSILGYPRPISSNTFITTSSSQTPSASSKPCLTSSSLPESSIIGRITNLPPLAKRKAAPHYQSGLNLLTSLAPSITTAFYHLGSVDNDEPKKESTTSVD